MKSEFNFYLILLLLFPGTIFISCKDNTVNPPPTSNKMTLIGQFNTSGYSQGIYVRPINNINYAFVADGSEGLQIINVSNPQSPSLTGNYNTIGEANDVFVSAINGVPYAFVSDGYGGYTILDVSNASNPLPKATISFPDYVNTSFIDSSNRISYVGTQAGYLQVFDLSGLPNLVVYLGGDTTADAIYGIQILNNLAYLAIGNLGLEIENVSVPAFPSFVSSFNTPGTSVHLQIGGSYAYIADGSAGVTIIDVTDVFNPAFYASVNTLDNAVGIYYNPNPPQIYTAEGTSGTELFTVGGSPPNPQQLGYYNNNTQSNAVYYYNPYIYLADGQYGLRILRYSP